MSLRRSLTAISALTVLAFVSACGSDDTSSTSPPDAAGDVAATDAARNDSASEASAEAAADATSDGSAEAATVDAANDAAGDVRANPNDLEGGSGDAAADAGSDGATDGGADGAKDVATDIAADVTIDGAKEAASDGTADTATDVTVGDTGTDASADVTVGDVTTDVAVDAPADAKATLDAFPDTGFVFPDASNDSGGSTAACEACTLQSCASPLVACYLDTSCTGAAQGLMTCLGAVGGDSGTTVLGCVTSLALSADSTTVTLGKCIVASCPTQCGVPAGIDAGQ